MSPNAMVPAPVSSSLTRLDRSDRQVRIGQLLNPTAARVAARSLGTSAAAADFYDRMGPALLRAVQALIGRPAVWPSRAGQVPRMNWPTPAGPPPPMNQSNGLSVRRSWEAVADNARELFGDAQGMLDRMEHGGATSQAELVAMQMTFQKASSMLTMASNVMRARRSTAKAMLRNLAP